MIKQIQKILIDLFALMYESFLWEFTCLDE